MSNEDLKYERKEIPPVLSKLGWVLLAAGILFGAFAFYTDSTRASFNYIVAFAFLISIGVGSLFLIALEYAVGAVWSVPIRRIVEFFAAIIPFLFILVIPLLVNLHEIFHWSHAEAVTQDEILMGKSPYLNIPFFIIRTFGIIALWSLFYLLFIRNSKKQDATGDQNLTKKNIKLSVIFIPLFAITITISAVDWLMSIEPHWFSTIFGVYFFSGTVVAALAAVTLAAVLLKEKGYLHPKITNDHLFSLGGLLFAFVNFWAYIAFSQFMLIWYADLPEETFWFLQRWEGAWAVFSILLIIIHFIVPYAMLVSNPSKSDPKRLKFVAIWLLFAHLFDLFWLVLPEAPGLAGGYVFSWIDLVFPFFIVGVVILIFKAKAARNNLLPVGDPKLKRGLDFHL